MTHFISSSCDPTNRELDARQVEPRLGAGDGCLEILGQASVIASQPCEGGLHHPVPGQEVKSLSCIGALDDLRRLMAEFARDTTRAGILCNRKQSSGEYPLNGCRCWTKFEMKLIPL